MRVSGRFWALVLSAHLLGCYGRVPTGSSPGSVSTTTGQEYNVEGGFQVAEFGNQPYGPNLVFIEGGRTLIGSFEEDVLHRRDNIERAVTVSSFYMDETEVANIHWLEYEYYIKADSDELYWRNNLPDTTVWSKKLAFNDPYITYYYRYPGFRFFPVVGINWRQASNYCMWRTNVVNTKLAEEAGYYDDPEDDQAFTFDPSARRYPPLESGIILPNYRLPTEAEWEYAAKALMATQFMDEQQTHNRIYPWDGHGLRYPYGNRTQGLLLANFKRGRGDYGGIAGKLNDGDMIPTSVYRYFPNELGLYNMAGNVNEWVYDVYRATSFQEMDDLNPIRRDDVNDPADQYDPLFSFMGNERPYTMEEAIATGISASAYDPENPPVRRMRVYKGGSWQDVAYWCAPGTRRAIFEDESSAAIGFRCAMIKTGVNY